MIAIIPISQTQVDLHNLLVNANAALQRNLGQEIDLGNPQTEVLARFLVALAAIQGRDVNIKLHEASSFARHITFGFLVLSDKETFASLLERTDLAVTAATAVTGDSIAVLTGTLKEWHSASLECCQAQGAYNLRLLFNKIVTHIEGSGFREFWADQRKRPLGDKTYYLEHKK